MRSFTSIFSHPDRFVRFSVATVLAFIAVHVVFFEIFASRYLKPKDSIESKKRYLAAHARDIRILALGDSHPHMGLNIPHPAYYNYARISDSVAIQYFKLKNLLPQAASLQVLLLQADCHQFSCSMTHFDRMPYAYLVDEPVDPVLGRYPAPGHRYWRLFSLQETVAPTLYRNLFRALFGPASAPGDVVTLPNGTASPTDVWASLPADERALRAKIHTDFMFYSGELMIEPAVNYYRRMLRMAQARRLAVVLIRYPLSLEYDRLVRPEVRQTLDRFYRGIQDEYKISLLDYTHLFDSRQDLFSDTNHLNTLGAGALGRRVLDDLAGLLPPRLLALPRPGTQPSASGRETPPPLRTQ